MPQCQTWCCLLLCVFEISCASASEHHKNDYLATYLVSWQETATNFENCNARSSGILQNSHFVLGECPTTNAINAYYISGALLHYTAIQILPGKYKRALMDTRLQFNFQFYQNYSQLGLGINF